ncbi:cupredoxin domain-containing protein [Endothiovibrio diazotrophicus]
MNSTRVLFLSLLCLLTSPQAGAEAAAAGQPTGADGFSRTFDDPRYTRLPTYLIEMKDGALLPAELVVPAKTKFRLVVRNVGDKPAEFESNQLRQEKVLFMGAEATLVITPLDAGSYDYFDDFAPAVHGKIVAKAKE